MAYTTVDNSELYFQTKLYTGNGTSSRAITLDGDENMQPNWVWIKSRNSADYDHMVTDSVRGTQKTLKTNTNGAEDSNPGAGGIGSFDSDGFTIAEGSINNTNMNNSGTTYVGWSWKAGDSNTSVSSSGSGNNAINACTHRANTNAGFSIVKYTGLNSEISNGQKTKVTHGLNAKPDFLIIKNKDSSSNWVATRGIDNDNHGVLNSSNAFTGSLFTGNQNQSDSTHFVVGNEAAVNANGDEFIAYVFAEKKGYSKFGSYKGNGNTDGSFIYTGFKPAWVIIKNASSAQNWVMFDSKRPGFNVTNDIMYPNNNDAETDEDSLDFLSNGFKIRSSGNDRNGSGNTLIYMCFAEAPFVNSNSVPTNAR